MPRPNSKLRWLAEAVEAHDSDKCLLWPFPLHKTGYGALKLEGRNVPAHRVAFFVAKGRWPDPCALHKCDVRACINPRHLFEGTKLDNNQDRAAKNRSAYGANNARSKLTADVVLAIRSEYIPNHRIHGARALARRYGVHHGTITGIASGEWWNHVG